MNFDGKRVLITGATRGIGKATAEAFLESGARVAVNGRTTESVARAIAELGGEPIVAAPGDVATAQGCRAVVATALDGLGGLDVLVNNAGLYRSGPAESFDEAEWDRIVDTNLKGTFFCTMAALDGLRAAGGNVVNLASESGLMGHPDAAVYCASKGGVVNMTRALALELAPDVRVNCICPGGVDTEMLRDDLAQGGDLEGALAEVRDHSPMKRLASAGEIAGSILFLASDAARNVTGAAWQTDGGSTAGH